MLLDSLDKHSTSDFASHRSLVLSPGGFLQPISPNQPPLCPTHLSCYTTWFLSRNLIIDPSYTIVIDHPQHRPYDPILFLHRLIYQSFIPLWGRWSWFLDRTPESRCSDDCVVDFSLFVLYSCAAKRYWSISTKDSDAIESLQMAEHGGRGGYCPPMDLFHSDLMHLIQVIVPIESARLIVSYLGDIGLIQFKDVNTYSLYTWPLIISIEGLNWSLLCCSGQSIQGWCFISSTAHFIWASSCVRLISLEWFELSSSHVSIFCSSEGICYFLYNSLFLNSFFQQESTVLKIQFMKRGFSRLSSRYRKVI